MAEAFKDINWRGQNINIVRERLRHLSFADGVALLTNANKEMNKT